MSRKKSVAGGGRPELRPRGRHPTHPLHASIHVLFCLPPAFLTSPAQESKASSIGTHICRGIATASTHVPDLQHSDPHVRYQHDLPVWGCPFRQPASHRSGPVLVVGPTMVPHISFIAIFAHVRSQVSACRQLWTCGPACQSWWAYIICRAYVGPMWHSRWADMELCQFWIVAPQVRAWWAYIICGAYVDPMWHFFWAHMEMCQFWTRGPASQSLVSLHNMSVTFQGVFRPGWLTKDPRPIYSS
jgi:hypothetical protein